jgi:hypothetical protein
MNGNDTLASFLEQQDQQLQWRRDKVQELCSKGYSQREIKIDTNIRAKNGYRSSFKFLIACAAAFSTSFCAFSSTGES